MQFACESSVEVFLFSGHVVDFCEEWQEGFVFGVFHDEPGGGVEDF